MGEQYTYRESERDLERDASASAHMKVVMARSKVIYLVLVGWHSAAVNQKMREMQWGLAFRAEKKTARVFRRQSVCFVQR